MLLSRSGILAEDINTKTLTLIPLIPTLIPCIPIIPTLIPIIPTLIPRIPTLIPCFPIIPVLILRIPIVTLIPFPDSPFRLLQIAHLKNLLKDLSSY